MNVLVLGHKGMLGHMVVKYLHSKNLFPSICEHRWPTKEFKSFIKTSKPDFIVNCIGAIPQRKKEFSVNYKLPKWLEKNCCCNIIHQQTDCNDDSDYGISKKKAGDFIINKGNNTKMIKTAIIGPELNTKASLLEWFLSQKGEVNGFSKAIWSGNTTLEWSKHCYNMIMHWEHYPIETTLQGETISKYHLLKIISEIWGKRIKIKKIEKGIDRSLIGDIKTSNIKSQLIELKNFLNNE
jgi:dTDP-4-dehydrorhamnose reductase